jgi:hypothetical protein
MATPSAVISAVDLARTPILVGIMRHRPLPPDVLTLIKCAAGSTEALEQSAAAVGRDAAFVRAAAKFYIRQILWAGDADHYRVLGVGPDAPAAKMAEHLRWYMKWLHPDTARKDAQEALAARVLRAWDAVKTPERRRHYDRVRSKERHHPHRTDKATRLATRRIPWIAGPMAVGAKKWSGKQWGAAATVAAAATLALVASLNWVASPSPEAISGSTEASLHPAAGAPPALPPNR